MTRRATTTVIAAIAMAVAVPGLSVSAQAVAPPVSNLIATPNPIVPVYLGTAPVSVNLDPTTCAQALSTGQAYAVNATSSNTSIVTVAAVSPGPIQCPGTNKPSRTPPATTQAFTVTSVATCTTATDGTLSTSIVFAAVAGPQGIQNKIGDPITVPVNLSGVPVCVVDPPPTPDPGTNPAAPAVANTYLNADAGAAVTTLCKALYGKSWRGVVISAIAAQMPKPESVKDSYSFADWTDMWRTAVNAQCGYAG